MANEIKEAMKKAVEEAEETGTAPELTARAKKLLARKKNLQRQKRQKLPSSLRK